MIKVLFVCLGNICRSPMAEAIFEHIVNREGLSDHFHIDSVGTGRYHVGDTAHPGTRQVLAAHGIQSHSRARQIDTNDLAQTDYLIVMDQSNKSDLLALSQRHPIKGELDLLLSFAPNAPVIDVPDPYYTDNFEVVYQLVESGCEGLLAHIRTEQGI